MKPVSIGDALFTKTQQKLLQVLYGKPDQSFYMNELVRLAGMGKGTIKRELARMHAAGLLTLTPRGNQDHYQANSNCPIFDELQGIVRKTFGVADVLTSALATLFDRMEFAFVYGSIAKGCAKVESDIDLMAISGTLTYTDLIHALGDAEKTLGRTVNTTIYDLAQFKRRWQEGNAFVTRVMDQPKIWIKGSENGIRDAR